MYIDLFEGNLVPAFDVSEKVFLPARYEHNRLSFRTGSTGTADSVNICLRILRNIVVDYECYILHIESSCRNIGRNEDITESILKSLERSCTIPLLHVSMETSCSVSVTIEHIGDILRFMLHSAEYDYFRILVILDIFLEHIVFLKVRNLDKGMIDLGYHELIGSLDGFVPVHSIFCEKIINLLWNSRGECHRLLHSSEAGPNHIDIVNKPHIEHSIHLIQDEVLYMREIDKPAFYEVNETTRSSDDDLRTVFESFPLGTDIGAPVYRQRSEKHSVGEFEKLFTDLHSKLASRSENNNLRFADIGIELLEKRNDEGGSLTGSRLGLSDNTLPFHGSPDNFFLDFGGFRVTVFCKRLKYFRIETEF